ncbi:MAG: phasin family protein [Dehalococcoidia bacterium]|nr:phasin family protein [Dehalococcoidia bacterium]
MISLLRKSVLVGIGLAYMTKDKVEEAARKIAAEDDLSEEEARGLAEDLLKQSEESRKNLKAQVEKFVKSTLEKVDIPSPREMRELEARIKKLEELLEKRDSGA